MGKEYESELRALTSTIQCARSFEVEAHAETISRMRGGDLIVLASGGSLGAAHFIAQLHMSCTCRLATVMTPLDFAMEDHPLDATVLFLSAGGTNHDILQAWNTAEHRGFRELVVVCGAPNSTLVQLAKKQGIKGIITFELDAGRDGFLATNSLVAFFSLALRLYDVDIPEVDTTPDITAYEHLLECDALVVLYGGWLKSVAIDIESRFVEAALAPVLVADYRNFAHGRHHWLAKRAERTAVLALVAPRFRTLAEDTLQALPSDVRVRRLEVATDLPVEALRALVVSFKLAGRAASRLGYDAGRPGVPEFGHTIYELRTSVSPSRRVGAHTTAVERKVLTLGAATARRRRELLEHCAVFEEKLTKASFAGIALDYDGTIVDTAKRFEAIDSTVASTLNRLLSEGLVLGIATGRGKSVHEKLRGAIDAKYFDRCFIGYYNGAAIRFLSENCEDLADGSLETALKGADAALRAASRLKGVVDIAARPYQITVTCKSLSESDLWLAIEEVLEQAAISAKVVRSSHSVDVIPHGVSKREVVARVASLAGAGEDSILKLGDRGRWPGNDAELLAMSHGLSVDEVSSDARSCWNLLPYGTHGAKATLLYLNRLRNGRYQVE